MPTDLHPTEEKFPQQAKKFKEITEKLYRVHLDKNQDYSPSNIIITGMPGALVRMWDKIARIFNLMGVPFPHIIQDLDESKDIIISVIKSSENQQYIIEVIENQFKYLESSCSMDFSTIKEKVAKNESLTDSLEDLANYAIIAILMRERIWGK